MNYFKAEVEGKRLVDFNKYDNSLKKLTERLNFVEELLYEDGYIHPFFATYNDKYYNSSPAQDGYLAEENSVFKLLDILGTYIMGANDVISHRKVEYKFWKNEREYRDYKQSSTVPMTTEDGREVETVHMFVDKKDKNQKIVGNTTINGKDLKQIEEIRKLEDAINFMKSPKGINSIKEYMKKILEHGLKNDGTEIDTLDIEKMRYVAKNTERYVDSYVKTLRDNQILIKESIKRPIKFKNPLKDEGAPDKLEGFDFMEKKHVEELLPFISSENLMTDMGVLAYDLNVLLSKTKLSAREQEVATKFRKGYSENEIIKELGIKKQNMKTYVSRIADKVVNTYEKQVSDYRDRIRLKNVK